MVENLPANAGDAGSILESGRSSREGTDNPLQNSCLGNSMDRGPWRGTVYGGRKESDMTEHTHTHTHTHSEYNKKSSRLTEIESNSGHPEGRRKGEGQDRGRGLTGTNCQV